VAFNQGPRRIITGVWKLYAWSFVFEDLCFCWRFAQRFSLYYPLTFLRLTSEHELLCRFCTRYSLHRDSFRGNSLKACLRAFRVRRGSLNSTPYGHRPVELLWKHLLLLCESWITADVSWHDRRSELVDSVRSSSKLQVTFVIFIVLPWVMLSMDIQIFSFRQITRHFITFLHTMYADILKVYSSEKYVWVYRNKLFTLWCFRLKSGMSVDTNALHGLVVKMSTRESAEEELAAEESPVKDCLPVECFKLTTAAMHVCLLSLRCCVNWECFCATADSETD
jgi:hypothetical protein